MGRTLQGKFRPKNPDKYKGDPTNIIYRSSWEKIFMNWLDKREEVVAWQSEEIAIWYYNPVTKRKQRYFPDFVVKYDKKGTMLTEVVEIKPQSQIDGPPQNPKRRTQAWARAVQTYIVNQAKWKAAMEYCEDRGMSFRLVSEKHLGI